jgi:hypothetical protein
MKYLVEGADKATGDDRTIIISADSPADAQNKVNAMGILVSNLQARESEPEQPIALGYASPKAPQRATPAPSLPGVPEYFGRKPIKLFVTGWVLIVVALLGFGGSYVVNGQANAKAEQIMAGSDDIIDRYKWKAIGESAVDTTEAGQQLRDMANQEGLNADLATLQLQALQVKQDAAPTVAALAIIAAIAGLTGIIMVIYWVGSARPTKI